MSNIIDSIKSGANQVWNGVKKAANATANYVKENKVEIAASLALSVVTGGGSLAVQAGM